jgi:hypothetical protein
MRPTMPTTRTIDSWLQHNLRMLTKDDLSIGYFESGNIDSVPDYSTQRWQLAVDMIYRCVVSGLLELTYPNYRVDHNAFFQAIRTQNPFDQSGGFLWNWEQLHGTDKLIALVDKHFPGAGVANYETVNPAFIQKLRDIFATAGVAWSDAPLLPIVAP